MTGKTKIIAAEELWELRGGIGGVESHVPYLGYSLAALRDILKNGYTLYKNGKRVKLCDLK